MHPYSDKTFFQFFQVLFKRLIAWMGGNPFTAASDEVQLGVLALVALSCAAVGSFLVFRKMTMLANSLSHTVLLGIVAAYLLLSRFSEQPQMMGGFSLGALFLAALITALLTTVFTEFFTKTLKLQEDASIGLIFSTFFALGVVLVTLFTKNVHIGTEAIMGNVDALQFQDVKLAGFIFALNATICGLFFKGFFSTTFDPGYSKSIGLSPGFFHYLLMALTAVTVICAFRAIGVFLVLALIVGPVLIARFFTQDFKKLILLSGMIGGGCAIFSVALSRHLLTAHKMALSTGGLCISMLFFAYICSALFSMAKHRMLSINARRAIL